MEDQFKKIQKLPIKITHWIGTTSSLVVHTIIFILCLFLPYFGFDSSTVLLVLTTLVSLEAIYLSILIQMTVNRNMESLEEVQEDVQEISEDVEDISEDIEKIQEEDREEEAEEEKTKITLEKIESGLQKLLNDIETLKNQPK